MQIRTYYLISNIPDGPRGEIYTWAINSKTSTMGVYVAKAKKFFIAKTIKWYCYYLQTVDTETGEVSIKILAKDGTEEIPPLEVNVEAKNKKKPIKFKELEIEL